jgi:predicted esterase
MEHFAYYDPYDIESVSKAVNDLREYVATEGPFQGILGFSQGATLGAMLLALSPMSFGIFICGARPFSTKWLQKGIMQLVDPSKEGPSVSMPTVHILGRKDAGVEWSWQLVETCSEEMRVVWDHGGGHEIPTKPEVVAEMVNAINRGIVKAAFRQ